MNKSTLEAIWPAKGKFASITWQVSDVCNYKCSYCNPGNFGANHKNLQTEIYIDNLRSMVSQFKANGYESFRFFFSGGEPTVWKPFIPILKYIREEIPGALVAVNTNLSKPLDWWVENHTLFNDIVASFHVEFCDKENYLKNMEYLQDKMDYLVCRLLMHDERFLEVVDFSTLLKEKLQNYTIEYAALMEALSPHSEMHYYKDEWKREFLKKNNLEEQKILAKKSDVPLAKPSYCEEHYTDGSIIGHNSNRVVSESQNNFTGWKCWINDAIFITPSGDVRIASCDMGKIVGNINNPGVKFTSQPVICNQARCNCGTDIGIRKAAKTFSLAQGEI
ncbi:MAG: hypothetical protein COW01_06185 [Bdellovibrionales bacterium CG12_big_fil_rev_8_21_14_0_65_38_15]|nr:MAG: hypothetical protein COW79_04080 [Bdellovibrionales bacterium CG22_combo_CG10-13_8_21_14_all_38_13]PIQ56016.1 MAG: hypothetical protein COW01_06185 [Bdellovibrionales bacterium CG12_big_fil_rev_8_21_14_0_65_38_15]PIR30621.1 MAG: hypothetical protein COV38_04725 [Bdellovibrionales bacterium CG11_big_fil_rev_8_21_14_0_20_38_13]